MIDTGFADGGVIRPLIRRIAVKRAVGEARTSVQALADLLNKHREPLRGDGAALFEQGIGLPGGDEQGSLGGVPVNSREGHAMREDELLHGVNLIAQLLDRIEIGIRQGLFSCAGHEEATGQPGTKRIGLSEAPGKTREYALLARGLSPYNEALAMQYCIPRCFQSGAPAPVFRKGGSGAALALQFEALEHLAAVNEEERFGYILAAHLPAV